MLFKKPIISACIMLMAVAVVAIGCNKHDDNDDWGDDNGGNGGDNPTINPVENGILPGLFSISSDQQVQFSQGNLQYQASTNTWRFAENQWVIIGEGNENISPTYTGWIDLFGWGTSGWDCGNTYYQPWNSDNSDGSLYGPPGHSVFLGSYSHSDWGIHNAIVNGGNTAGQWHTLLKNDWKYLYYTRSTTSNIRFAIGQVDGINGLILLPDDWDSNTYTLNDVNQFNASTTSNVISASEWLNDLQPYGAVFLPFAGIRLGTVISGANGDNGAYWSSQCEYDYNQAWPIPLRYNTMSDYAMDRCNGLSVRLVRSVQGTNNDTEIQVTTHVPSEITQTSARCGGEAVVPQGQTLTELGICWSTSQNPTISDSHLSTTNWNEPFACTVTNLQPNTLYHIRAYAVQGSECYYGEDKSFTTIGNGGGGFIAPNITIHQGNGYISYGDAVNLSTEFHYGFDMSSNLETQSELSSLEVIAVISASSGTLYFPIDEIDLSGMSSYIYVNSYLAGEDSPSIQLNEFIIKATVTDKNNQSNSAEIKVLIDHNNGGNTEAPEGAINGLFSVSATEKVYFSQGNLQYQASTKKWRFAEHQWDVIGENNKNISATYNGWIDLFGWGTSGHYHGAVCYQPWSTSTNVQDYYAYGSVTCNLYDQTGQADWGSNPIINGGNTAGLWRTLTHEEWMYVLSGRNTYSNIHYATARVNGVSGLILLPDNWSTNYYNLDNTDDSQLSFNNVIDLSTWENVFQAHGAVFLPAAGIRHGTNYIPPSKFMGYGRFWSASTNNNSFVYSFNFERTSLSNSFTGHSQGLSVRLVRTAN